VTHNGHVFAAFGSSVSEHNVTGYTKMCNGSISLARWDGTTMLNCFSEVLRQFHDGSIALVFRLTHGRFIRTARSFSSPDPHMYRSLCD
jgi:hypothetical protein